MSAANDLLHRFDELHPLDRERAAAATLEYATDEDLIAEIGNRWVDGKEAILDACRELVAAGNKLHVANSARAQRLRVVQPTGDDPSNAPWLRPTA